MQKNIKLLALFNFFTDFRFYSAVLVLYFAKVTGSYALAMSLFSVTMVSSAVFEVPTGVFSDFIGRKKTIVLGAVSSVFSVVFYAIGINYTFLFIGALFEGLQRAWYSGNNTALLHDTLSSLGRRDDYDHYLGKTSSMFQLASAAAIILGSVLAIWSFAIIMWLSVIPQVICLILALKVVEPKQFSKESANIYLHLKSAVRKILVNRKLRLLSLNSVIGYAIGESTYQFRAAFVNQLWPLWAVGFARVLSSIGAGISFWFSGKIIKKLGAFRLLLLSNIYSKVINIFSVAYATIVSPVLLSTTSLWYGATEVAESKLMQKEFSDSQRATLGSLTSFFGNLAFGVYAIILGIFADKLGPTSALLISYILGLPTLWINWLLFKDNRSE